MDDTVRLRGGRRIVRGGFLTQEQARAAILEHASRRMRPRDTSPFKGGPGCRGPLFKVFDVRHFYGSPPATFIKGVVVTNVSVWWLWQLTSLPVLSPVSRMQFAQFMRTNFTFGDGDIAAGRYWTAFTHAFSHISPKHLVGNMLTFYTSATALSSHLGSSAIFHIASLIGSTAGLTGLVGPWFLRQMMSRSLVHDQFGRQMIRRISGRAIGASAVCMAILAAKACLAPFANVVVNSTVSMPQWMWTLVAICIEVIGMADENTGRTNVGHQAHLAGFTWGMIYYALFLRGYGGIWYSIRWEFDKFKGWLSTRMSKSWGRPRSNARARTGNVRTLDDLKDREDRGI